MEKNPQISAEWFRKAAEQGMVMAQYNLVMVQHTDPKEIYFWMKLAIPHLKDETLRNATAIWADAASHLTAAERTEVEARVKVWLAVHSAQN
jgi:TPR repeat protein